MQPLRKALMTHNAGASQIRLEKSGGCTCPSEISTHAPWCAFGVNCLRGSLAIRVDNDPEMGASPI